MVGQKRIPPTPPSTNLSGKTVVVTGANTGIGYAASLQLLKLGVSTLVLAVRTISKGDAARTSILPHATNPDAQVLVWELDLTSHKSVLAFAQRALKELVRIDILLLNAGMNHASWTVSPETGNESLFQVNFLSTALLSAFLLPLLQPDTSTTPPTPARLSFVSSQAMQWNSISKKPVPPNSSVFDHFNDPSNYSGLGRYSDSKVLGRMWAHTLAAHVDPSRVVVNALCPGMVVTDIGPDLPFWYSSLVWIARKVLARDPEEGGRTLVYASAVAGEDTHGKMLTDNTILKKDYEFLQTEQGKQVQQKVWDETWALAETLEPGAKNSAGLIN